MLSLLLVYFDNSLHDLQFFSEDNKVINDHRYVVYFFKKTDNKIESAGHSKKKNMCQKEFETLHQANKKRQKRSKKPKQKQKQKKTKQKRKK